MAEALTRKRLGLLADQHGLILEQCSFGMDTYPSKLTNPTYLLEHYKDDYIGKRDHCKNLAQTSTEDSQEEDSIENRRISIEILGKTLFILFVLMMMLMIMFMKIK